MLLIYILSQGDEMHSQVPYRFNWARQDHFERRFNWETGGNLLKTRLTLQWLLQINSHVLPVSPLCKTVMCLLFPGGKKNPESFLSRCSWGEMLTFPLHSDFSQQCSGSLAVRVTHTLKLAPVWCYSPGKQSFCLPSCDFFIPRS